MEKKIYAKNGVAIIEFNGYKIELNRREIDAAMEAIRSEKGEEGDFLTLYTDASFLHAEKEAQVAYKGRCKAGVIEGIVRLDAHDSNYAEMLAIEEGVRNALEKFPDLKGFYIRSDNQTCVHAFWDFDRTRFKVASVVAPSYERIQSMLNGRWTRAKWIKAHSGGKDTPSIMNNIVDKRTRVRGENVRTH